MRSYGSRFVIFQLSKYAWAVSALLLLGALATSVRGSLPAAVGVACAALVAGYAAFRMTNQYRCPNAACNTLLAFAHGTSAGAGSSTRCDVCPYCGTSLG